MIESKEIKENSNFSFSLDPDELPFIKKVFYYLKLWFIKKPKRFFLRNFYKLYVACEYAKFSWNNYDWDFAYTYELIHFKLKRVYKALEKGNAVQETEDMKALKELTKIVYRLYKGGYDRKYNRVHDKKWGKLEIDSIPEYDQKGKIKFYRWEFWRSNCPKDAPEEIKNQERADNKSCYDRAEIDRCKDIDRLAEILKKHALKWWD